VRYTGTDKWFCNQCTPPEKIRIGTYTRDVGEIPGLNSGVVVLILVAIHIVGLVCAFLLFRKYWLGRPIKFKDELGYNTYYWTCFLSACVFAFTVLAWLADKADKIRGK
jgi:hypothetical protein